MARRISTRHVQLTQRWGGSDREDGPIRFKRLREEGESIGALVGVKAIGMATMRFARL